MSEDVLKSFYICAMAQSSVGIRDKLYVYCDSKSSITRKTDTHTRGKKIADKQRVIKELQELDRIPEVARNACFKRAQHQTTNTITSSIRLPPQSKNRYFQKFTARPQFLYCGILNNLPPFKTPHALWQTVKPRPQYYKPGSCPRRRVRPTRQKPAVNLHQS